MNYDNDDDNNELLSEINIIPFVDVMLVLLILFIITAPLLTPNAVKIELPKASSQKISETVNKIVLAIDQKGNIFWNDEAITREEYHIRLKQAAQKKPIPELHLRAHKETQYQNIAQIMSDAQKAGISRLGFMTEPVK